jgi:hypothetical protein
MQVSTIDPSLDLGLHELANSGSFRFQLQNAEAQTKDILSNLDDLVENTIEKAPTRTKDFCLNRVTNRPLDQLTDEEDKWERQMYEKWGPKGSGEYVFVCKRIQTYQYPLRKPLQKPLQNSPKDKYWGNIDLLGIGTDFLPVPNELKRREANESPLRMLVEVAAYGIAIRKVWPNLREHWVKALSWFEGSPSQFPTTLDKVTLVCVAPNEYWCSCLGQRGRDPGAFPPEAWPPFWALVDPLGKKGFDTHFVAVEASWNDTAEQPTITGARVLELRSLSGR